MPKNYKSFEFVGNNKIDNIIGAASYEPSAEDKKIHNKYWPKFTLEQKSLMDSVHVKYKEQVIRFMQLVDINDHKTLPDNAYKIWVAEENPEKIARTAYDEGGNVYMTLDLDDIKTKEMMELVHIARHEFFHLISFHQTYKYKENIAGLDKKTVVFQVGTSFTQSEIYKVSNIRQTDWADFIEVLATYKKAQSENKSEFTFQATAKCKSMIALAKAKYGKTWVDDSISYLQSEGKNIFNYNAWKAEIDIEHGTMNNETIVEFLARVSGMQNPLQPTIKEVEWFEGKGYYGNFQSIMDLMTLYLSLDQFEKHDMLKILFKTIHECNPQALIDFFKSHKIDIQNSEVIDADLVDISVKVSPWKALGNVFRSSF